MRNAFKGYDGEVVGLSGVDVLDLVPVSLSSAGESAEAISGAGDRQGGYRVVNVGSAVLLNRNLFPIKYGAHQSLSFEESGVFGAICEEILSHEPAN